MALKLRRRLEVFTNGMLPHRRSGCEPNSVSGGAASFKRVLGGAPLRADRFFRIEKIPFTVSAAFNDKSIIADRLITDHLRRSSGRPKPQTADSSNRYEAAGRTKGPKLLASTRLCHQVKGTDRIQFAGPAF